MARKEVTTVIDDDMSAVIDVKGAKGRECLGMTADIETALAGKVVDDSKRKVKSEMRLAGNSDKLKRKDEA